MIALLATIALSGVFDAPTPQQEAQDRIACYQSRWCRWIDPRPAELVNAAIDARSDNCALAASKAVAILSAQGIEARIAPSVWVRYDGPSNAATMERDGFRYALHSYAEARMGGEWWAVDPSLGLPRCGGVCTVDEARHGLRIVRP